VDRAVHQAREVVPSPPHSFTRTGKGSGPRGATQLGVRGSSRRRPARDSILDVGVGQFLVAQDRKSGAPVDSASCAHVGSARPSASARSPLPRAAALAPTGRAVDHPPRPRRHPSVRTPFTTLFSVPPGWAVNLVFFTRGDALVAGAAASAAVRSVGFFFFLFVGAAVAGQPIAPCRGASSRRIG